MTSARTLFCPSDTRPGAKFGADFTNLTPSNVSYSYVPNLLWNDGRTNVILWLDRIYTTEHGDRWPAGSNHGSAGGNVAFTDGHVDFFRELPVDLRDKDGNAIVLSP
jgi:prepilin-type processing-associated H-X9-DG protein